VRQRLGTIHDTRVLGATATNVLARLTCRHGCRNAGIMTRGIHAAQTHAATAHQRAGIVVDGGQIRGGKVGVGQRWVIAI